MVMNEDNINQIFGYPITKILVLFDNSSHANRAFGHALDLAKKFGASMVVLSVIQDVFKKKFVYETPTREKNMSKKSQVALKKGGMKFQTEARKFGIDFEHIILTSEIIDESILSFISSKKIDYVVMGSRGKGMHKEMMLGRVSTSVAVNANCPVVLVK